MLLVLLQLVMPCSVYIPGRPLLFLMETKEEGERERKDGVRGGTVNSGGRGNISWDVLCERRIKNKLKRIVCFPSEHSLKQAKLSFLYGYQLAIAWQ